MKTKQIQNFSKKSYIDLRFLSTLNRNDKRLNRWYFGGVGSAMAACFTHPLDLIKVYQQTKSEKETPKRVFQILKTILKNDGIRGMYNGISASMLRQLTYASSRSGLYEIFKRNLRGDDRKILSFHEKVATSGVAGALAGFIGTPADVVNVRMQNDIKLDKEKRRNYKNAFDGLYSILRNEGVLALFSGSTLVCSRALLMSMGTFSVYDQAKETLLAHECAADDAPTHLCVSCLAAFTSTLLVHPLDVLKTRLMSGGYQHLSDCLCCTAKMGLFEFYRGFLPAWCRATPQTALTFVFAEELRLWFGISVQ